MPDTTSPVLIYGGSFDPPHRGHVQLPEIVRTVIGASKILYIPAGTPPHKSRRVTPAPHRLAMLQLALTDQTETEISTIELDRDGPSYTVDTLESLRCYPELGIPAEAPMRLLIGADMAMIFDQWRSAARVAELAEPVVMVRPPLDARSLLDQLATATTTPRSVWQRRLVETPAIDIASTELRRELASGQYGSALIQENLAPAVIDYIRANGLYLN